MIGFAEAVAKDLVGFMGSTFNEVASSMRASAILDNGANVFTGFTGFAPSLGESFNGVTISGAAVGAVTVTTGASAGGGAGNGGAGNGTAAKVIGFGGTMGAGFEVLGRSRLGANCVGNSSASSTATIAIDNPMEIISLRRRIAQSP
jgi:hypothetical protein